MDEQSHVVGMFTSRDLLNFIDKYTNNQSLGPQKIADALNRRVLEVMVPDEKMVIRLLFPFIA
jgi:Mg2+/Co2+ transporter CorC